MFDRMNSTGIFSTDQSQSPASDVRNNQHDR